MLVYVQAKAGDSNQPYSISASIAFQGFIMRGCHFEFFSLENLDNVPFCKEYPVICGVGAYNRIFTRLGFTWRHINYPSSLKQFLGRETGTSKLRELPALLEKRPVFVKPLHDDKRFTGFVCKGPEDCWNIKLGGLDQDFDILWSDPVDIVAEYRVYVLNGDIQNVARYVGKVDALPSMNIVRQMIRAYTGAPIAYGLDVGILNNGQTILVEVNEGLALGNYGLSPLLHAKMIAARWFELVGDRTRMGDFSESQDSPPFINRY
jgi:hypothetical protein